MSGGDTRYVLTSDGENVQASDLLQRNLEPAIRFSRVSPNVELAGRSGADRQRQISIGLTKDLKVHRVKMQGELLHDDYRNAATFVRRGTWRVRTSTAVGM